MVRVIAGNFREFRFWQSQGVVPPDARYVFSVNALRGWRGEVLLVGNWYDNPVWNQVPTTEQLEEMGYTLRELAETR